MDSMLTWLNGTWIASLALDSAWSWVIAETIHFFGMAVLMGSIAIIDLRLMGFFRSIPLVATHRLLPLVIGGFSANLLTGIVFFCGDPFRYAYNWSFRIKMILVFLAGLNALYFTFVIEKKWGNWDPHGNTPVEAKVVAFISLLFWVLVTILGRMIPYWGDIIV